MMSLKVTIPAGSKDIVLWVKGRGNMLDGEYGDLLLNVNYGEIP